MPPLEPPNLFHLSAAIGWLELGSHLESNEELAKISQEFQEHPDVLEVRWSICAADKNWEAGLSAAERLMEKAPERASSWLHQAYALRRSKRGGLQQARDALRPAFEKFPKEPVVPYNLACYAAQLGQLSQAWEWIEKAITAAGNVGHIKEMALADCDLEPLWDRIRQL